jgi:flagellin-like protein
MQSTRLGSDGEAVSPVIGVVLMVAIVVILAAVVGAFALQTERLNDRDTPRAKFSFEYTETSSSGDAGYLKITLDSGNEIRASELRLRGDGITNVASTSKDDDGLTSPNSAWGDAATYAPASMIESGESIYVGVASDYDIALVWTSNDVDRTVTLAEDTGPDA